MQGLPKKQHNYLKEIATELTYSKENLGISTGNVWSAAGLQGKSLGAIDKSAAMYSAFEWRTSLLAMMSSAACLSLQVGRSLRDHYRYQVEGTPL